MLVVENLAGIIIIWFESHYFTHTNNIGKPGGGERESWSGRIFGLAGENQYSLLKKKARIVVQIQKR